VEQEENGPKEVPPPYLPRKTTKNHETPHSGTQLRNPHSKKSAAVTHDRPTVALSLQGGSNMTGTICV
jgi:hypothetical protein